MKKRKLSDLSIKKQTISNLQASEAKGGGPAGPLAISGSRITSVSGPTTCWDECFTDTCPTNTCFFC